MAEPRSYARTPRGGGDLNNRRNGPASYARADNFAFVPQDDPLIRNSRAPQSFVAPPPPDYVAVQPAYEAPVAAMHQPQAWQAQHQQRLRKVGEKLAKRYDMTEVRPEDVASVNAAILIVCTLEDSAPELDVQATAKDGYYAIIIKGFNENIDGPNMAEALRPGGHPDANIVGWKINPHTGTLIVRVGMQKNGRPVLEDDGGIMHNGGPKKRGRVDPSDTTY